MIARPSERFRAGRCFDLVVVTFVMSGFGRPFDHAPDPCLPYQPRVAKVRLSRIGHVPFWTAAVMAKTTIPAKRP